MEENPIEDDYNVNEGQKDMLNDEFDTVDMNNPDDEIGIDEGEGVGEDEGEGPDLESNFPPTPMVGSNNPCASQSSRMNDVRDD
ncbi:hypothetical protein EJD97_021091 [Solanum chilense]|uniref:Uncharacterized protein n=1 Tax=Solanum chilense TaxID=4083 RepID=A0A6N2CAE1_SOLCI|nr:hypothetical protein EJD97_021091 [Solanum chilense]